MSTSLSIFLKANNKKQTKNITNVNPKATNEQLKELAETLNGLTTNTYTGADRITENDVDEEIQIDLTATSYLESGYGIESETIEGGLKITFTDNSQSKGYITVTYN